LFISNYLDESQGSISIHSYEVLCEKSIIEMVQLKVFVKSYLVHLNSIRKTKRSLFDRIQKRNKQTEYEINIVSLEKEYEKLLNNLTFAVDKIIRRIVENFYMIYIFFEALFLYAKFKNDLGLKCILLSQIDRILDIVNPELLEKTLNNQDLLYYHLLYEIKELRYKVINDI